MLNFFIYYKFLYNSKSKSYNIKLKNISLMLNITRS